jgi:D-sedoheptulose 7-phosphate isomerase
MDKLIKQILDESIKAKQDFVLNNLELINKAALEIVKTLNAGNKILLFGNGGSAADCQHIAAEFINRFQIERRPLAAVSLTTDTSVITSIGNDYSFDDIFTKQIQALGKKGDIALGISTSGNSTNIIKGANTAKEMGLTVMGFSGTKGKLKKFSDFSFCVNSKITARIQEVHILIAHMLCDLSERIIFND